jgi:AraC-like DNA-binding protein
MIGCARRMTGNLKNMTDRLNPASKPAGPTVGAGFARGLFEFAVSRGADRAALHAASGITPEAFADQDGRIPMMNYVALMRAGVKLSGDPALALHYGEAVNISEVSIVGLVGRASKTMGEALQQLNRYVRLVVEAEAAPASDRFQRMEDAEGFWIVDTRLNANSFPELTESAFAQLVCHTREFGHAASRPMVQEVHVTHARPDHWQEYERVLRAPTVFSSTRNAMRVDPEWTTYSVARDTPYVFNLLKERADALLADLEASKTMRARVEALVLPILHTGDTGVDSVARKLGVSRQTLARRLSEEETTYEKTLDALRHRMALHYLDGRKTTIIETAYLVGFSDPSAFSRAFKRWTGKSPRNRQG